MMKLRNALVLAGLVSLFAAPAAMAMSISLVGVGNLGMPSNAGANTADSWTGLSGKMGYGGGALIDLPLAPRFGLEIGAIYRPGSFAADATNFGGASGATYTIAYNTLEVPVTFRIWLHRVFFITAGGYAASMMGPPTATSSDGTTPTASGWGDLNQNTLSYGVVGGAGLNIPLGGSVALRVEGRYEMQLSNSFNSTVTTLDSTGSFKYNAAEFLVGLTIGGMGRER